MWRHLAYPTGKYKSVILLWLSFWLQGSLYKNEFLHKIFKKMVFQTILLQQNHDLKWNKLNLRILFQNLLAMQNMNFSESWDLNRSSLLLVFPYGTNLLPEKEKRDEWLNLKIKILRNGMLSSSVETLNLINLSILLLKNVCFAKIIIWGWQGKTHVLNVWILST